jgi:hypothetical protein
MKIPIPKTARLYSTLLILAFIISPSVAGIHDNVPQKLQSKTIRINPEFKINRISNGSVIVTSKNAEDSEVKHEFTDFYADLLMAAYRKQGIDFIIENLRKKYYLSEDDCRRELKHALNILSEWKIILRDDDYAQQR